MFFSWSNGTWSGKDVHCPTMPNVIFIFLHIGRTRFDPVVDFTKSCKSKISRKCEFQPIKSLEITLTITLKINLRLTTFCEIDPRWIIKKKWEAKNTTSSEQFQNPIKKSYKQVQYQYHFNTHVYTTTNSILLGTDQGRIQDFKLGGRT